MLPLPLNKYEKPIHSMDEKISLPAIENYSEAFAATVASEFYSHHQKVTGSQLVGLTEIKQVNLFIIRELMTQWQNGIKNLRSPYFDYDAVEVAESLKNFQNILSNHISIGKSDLIPLLKRAVHQTLYLLLDPYDFYSETLDTQGKASLLVTDLKNHIKYVKVNRAPLEKLLEKLEEKKIISITGNEAFALLDSILEEVNFTPEEIDSYINQFSNVWNLSLEKLYENKSSVVQKAAVKEVKKPATSAALKIETLQTTLPLVKEEKPKINEVGQKVSRIKDKLSINQKFMFTKMLFHGDFEIFTQAIDRLDTLDSFSQAKAYLEKTYPEWDIESEEYAEFITLIERKFLA